MHAAAKLSLQAAVLQGKVCIAGDLQYIFVVQRSFKRGFVLLKDMRRDDSGNLADHAAIPQFCGAFLG